MDNIIEIKVDGQMIEVDVDADLTITDISEGMDRVSSLLGWYGNLLSAAREQADNLDANYRAWRGRRVNSILVSEQKLAEYKVNARINADKDFLAHKRGMAAAHRTVVRLDRAWSALDRMASILQSKGALKRSELRATGMHTRDRDPDDREEGEPRRSRRPTPEDRKADLAGRTKNHGARRRTSED